jgi:putative transposase
MNISNPIEKQYHRTNSSVYSCQYHVIFCPKYRRSVLVDGIDARLKDILIEKQQDFGYEIIEMEVMADHVHLILDVNPDVGVASVISKIKGYSSRTLRKEYPSLKKRLPCLWTRSKFISTVGSVSLEVVKKYIENQKGE